MSVLKQNHFMYDAYTVMDTVIMGNQRLYDCGKEKDAIYEKPEMTDEDGVRAAELERNSPSWAAGRPNPTPAG
jgi:ATPase subunit of ABC transporter with duplicated ATPase domains